MAWTKVSKETKLLVDIFKRVPFLWQYNITTDVARPTFELSELEIRNCVRFLRHDTREFLISHKLFHCQRFCVVQAIIFTTKKITGFFMLPCQQHPHGLRQFFITNAFSQSCCMFVTQPLLSISRYVIHCSVTSWTSAVKFKPLKSATGSSYWTIIIVHGK